MTVTINEVELALMVRATGGPIVADLERRAIRVQNVATRLCPVDTGRLRASIDHHLGMDAQGPYVDIGSNVEYAAYVELGTSTQRAQPYLRPALAAAGGI